MSNKIIRRITAVLLCAATLLICGCTETPEVTSVGTNEDTDISVISTEAEKVTDMINKIISGSVADEERTTAAENAYIAYYALSEEERAQVTNADKLPELRNEAAKLYIVKEYSDTRIDHSKIQIGTYWVRLSDPEHLAEIKDCGIDYVWQPPGDRESLDNFQNAGLGVMEYIYELGALPWLGEPDPEGYEAFLGDIQIDHPAVWGYYMTDEPSAELFDVLEAHGNVLKKYLPESTSIINLPPIDSAHYQSYVDYVNTFLEKTTYEQIVYDNYIFFKVMPSAMDNMWVISEAADKSGRDYWLIVSVSDTNKALLTEQLLLEGYAALAYGCVNLSYCCWTADPNSWGFMKVLDQDGNKTEVYDRLKAAIADIKSFSPVYMQYKHKATTLMIGENFKSADLKEFKKQADEHTFESIQFSKIKDMSVSDESLALVGGFEKKVGSAEGFFLVNCTNQYFRKATSATVTFTVDDSVSRVVAYVKGIPTVLTPENGVYTVTADKADAVFVTVE